MNSRIASAAYSARSFDRMIRWSNGAEIEFTALERCYSAAATADEVLATAGDPEAIKAVSAQAMTMFIEGVGGSGKTDDLLYIIREEDHSRACKIGYACKPFERLLSLQCGTWRKLKVEAVFCPVKANIPKLERAVLAAAERRGLRIRGEWVSATPKEAVELILKVARKKDYALCDGEVFLENLAARVRCLRKRQVEYAKEVEGRRAAFNRRFGT